MLPQLASVGGMASFQHEMSSGLKKRGYEVTYSIQDTPFDAILVIGGTRDLIGLRSAKRKGIPIIHRLNGMNWIHKVRSTGIRHFIRAEYGNLILSYIRERIADRIVYQSEFARAWWERERGSLSITSWVVHNGVNLQEFHPDGAHQRPKNISKVLMVEGNVGGGYEFGLETGYELINKLNSTRNLPVELVVVGAVDRGVLKKWESRNYRDVHFTGQVPHDKIPEIDRSAHVLYSADINAACPNAVIEALACGLPVAGFATGALDEIVSGRGGEIIPYGGNPWKLEVPDITKLAEAVELVINSQAEYRTEARRRAEEAFSLENMVDGYLEAIED